MGGSGGRGVEVRIMLLKLQHLHPRLFFRNQKKNKKNPHEALSINVPCILTFSKKKKKNSLIGRLFQGLLTQLTSHSQLTSGRLKSDSGGNPAGVRDEGPRPKRPHSFLVLVRRAKKKKKKREQNPL